MTQDEVAELFYSKSGGRPGPGRPLASVMHEICMEPLLFVFGAAHIGQPRHVGTFPDILQTCLDILECGGHVDEPIDGGKISRHRVCT